MKSKLFKRTSRVKFNELRLKAADPKEVYAGLLRIRDERLYKTQWPFYQFKRIFGYAPDFGKVHAMEPSSDLIAWLKRQARNYGQQQGRIRDKATAGNGLALARIEAILTEIERLDRELGGIYREPSDREALRIASRIERRIAANQRNKAGPGKPLA